jgi:tetratricopeptide (TPR) repeat protein
MDNKPEEEVESFLAAARICFALGDYAGAAGLYKAALRRIRDERGASDQQIADVFEELACVHAATGRFRKCASIYNRVRVIRWLHAAITSAR